MGKNTEKFYLERIQRVKDVVELREPDRVPFTPFFTFFPARYAGITCQEAMYDLNKLEMALEKLVIDLQPDACPDTYRVLSWASILEVLDYKQLVWPGHGLNPNMPYQFVEKEYMKAEEYDDFLTDPTGFLLSEIFPRIYGALADFKGFPSVPSAYYTRIVPFAAAFASPGMAGAVDALMKAGAEAQQVLKRGATFSKKIVGLGFPPQFVSGVSAPFDYIGDLFRGTRGIMLDMYRCPDKLLEVLERVYNLLIKPILKVPKLPGVNLVFIPLHKGLDGFMSQDHFRTFYWPTLKKMMLSLIDAGFTPCPFWEGNCTTRLEIIADMPKGKVVYWFEKTDMFKAKEILGDRICIRGNIPAALLNVGTSQEVKAYCKKLIEIAGKGGGLIIDGAIGIPDEAKPQNVMAIAEAVREHGRYH